MKSINHSPNWAQTKVFQESNPKSFFHEFGLLPTKNHVCARRAAYTFPVYTYRSFHVTTLANNIFFGSIEITKDSEVVVSFRLAE